MAQSLARARRIALLGNTHINYKLIILNVSIYLEQKKKEDMERIATNESKVDEDIDDLGICL